MRIHIKVQGKPFAWKRVSSRSGQKFTDPACRRHQQMLAAEGVKVMGHRPPFFGPVKLLVVATFEIPPSWPKGVRLAAEAGEVYHDSDPDYDNIAKQVADALKFVAFVDDNQVADGRAILRYGVGARTEIWLEELHPPVTPAGRRRGPKWIAGGYDPAIAKAPCGRARWPSVLDALRREVEANG